MQAEQHWKREGLMQPHYWPCHIHPAMLWCVTGHVPTPLWPYLEVDLWAL